MRHGGMSACTLDRNMELIDRGQQRSGTHADFAHRLARPVMNAEHVIDFKIFEQTFVDHLVRAIAAFFSRLEYQMDFAVKVFCFVQIFGSGKQCCRMPVMTAGMHLAGGF